MSENSVSDMFVANQKKINRNPVGVICMTHLHRNFFWTLSRQIHTFFLWSLFCCSSCGYKHVTPTAGTAGGYPFRKEIKSGHAQMNFLKNDPSSFRVLTNAEFHLSFLSSPGMDPGHRWKTRFRDDYVYDVNSLSYPKGLDDNQNG